MSDLLLLVAPPGDRRADPVDPAPCAVVWPLTSSGATAWAARLHDELDARRSPPSSDDVARITSWLRTQGIGRDTIVVNEPRLTGYASTWAAGATRADVPQTRLTHSADSAGELVEPIEVEALVDEPAAEPTALPRHLRLEQMKLWVLDRAEDTARVAVRALQR
jgi:hypothetical protein